MKRAVLPTLCSALLAAACASAPAEPATPAQPTSATGADASRPQAEQEPEAAASVGTATAARPALLDRVVVVGASLSNGFGLRNELGVDVTFADVLEAAYEPDLAPREHTDSLFYMDPVPRGGGLLERALAEEPSLLIAIDFPFWYAHDYRFMWRGYDERVTGLDLALELLDRYEGPIILGDLPDVSVSLEGVGPLGTPMIPAPAIPDAETLAQLNERLRAWAAERPRVVLVSIEDFLGKIVAGEPIAVRDLTVPPGSLTEMLQEDLLHPTLRGECALAVVVLDALARAHPEISDEPFRWTPDEIRAELWERTAAARAEAQERERKREERRKKREERQRAKDAEDEETAAADAPARAAA